MLEQLSLTIAALPDQQTTVLAIDKSERVSSVVPVYYKLDNRNFIPHFLLGKNYHFDQKQAIEQFLKSFDPYISPFPGHLEPFESDNEGNLYWGFQQILASWVNLQRLQKDILKFSPAKPPIPKMAIAQVIDPRNERTALKSLGQRAIHPFTLTELVVAQTGPYNTISGDGILARFTLG